MPLPWLLAQQEVSRTYFEWGRIQSNVDWILPIGMFVLLGLFARYWYQRDAAELGSFTRLTLTGLRTLCFVALLWIYLQPQWRTEHDVTINSQAVLLVDSSLSMGLSDENFPSSSTAPHRAQRVIQALSGERLLNELRRTHDVTVMRFDQQSHTVTALRKLSPTDVASQTTEAADSPGDAPIDWATALSPRGVETRIGQALLDVMNERQRGPLSGIVLFTDGRQNAGPGPAAAIKLAQQSGVVIHPVGLGSSRQPINVRISDVVAPARAFPNDTYTVTAYVQAQGMSGRNVRLELHSSPARDGASPAPGDGVLEGATDVRLADDGEAIAVRFDITPEQLGRRTLTARVIAPPDDSNPNDNQQQADVEVVDQKTRVLLFASGPSREYRFLHTLLYRDDNIEVDILLGTSQPGIAQEARQILDSFPDTREALDEYDVVIAIDPDWQSLSPQAIDSLEQWLSNQAGGLVVLAGPVFGDIWTERPQLAKIRDLYPVEFRRRFSLSVDGGAPARDPSALDFTREGLEADFLWLADSVGESQQSWASFPGVYECLDVRGPKPGATVYAQVVDPRTGGGEPLPYFCGQFYGAGRVFYIGSGEMWRLRGVDTNYFDQFYTKVVRQVAQGRLLRGSSRGVLLTERDRYFLGQTIDVRAQLNDSRLEPLRAANVSLVVTLPDNTVQTIQLDADSARQGNYGGQFMAGQEGGYRLDIELPDGSGQRLSKRIQVRVPDLERENPSRNDPLLSELAESTGGHYYLGIEDALGANQAPPVWQQLADRSLTHPESDRPRPLWDTWYLLAAVVGCLSLEWLLRRLMKLA